MFADELPIEELPIDDEEPPLLPRVLLDPVVPRFPDVEVSDDPVELPDPLGPLPELCGQLTAAPSSNALPKTILERAKLPFLIAFLLLKICIVPGNNMAQGICHGLATYDSMAQHRKRPGKRQVLSER